MRHWFCLLALLAGQSVAAAPLKLEGELYARDSAALMPPSIDRVWQLNIAQLTPDGTPVRQGDVVVQFEGGDVQKRLMETSSALAEKQSQLDKLQLELAEREKTERLATEQARAARDKAQRKASQPEDLLRRVDYQKLVAEREHAERSFELAERRERLAAEARRQELRLLESERQQLQQQVEKLQQAVVALQVRSPRDGVMQHLSDFQGNKFDVGSQVWRGIAVAQVPDPASLAVRATVAEHLSSRIAVGAPARVVVEGSGTALSGRVAELGRVIRSKSKLQPVPVLDLLIELDDVPARLKPGQAVRVELDA